MDLGPTSQQALKYCAEQFNAIDAGSALPKELVHLIASYVPPDFAQRWKFLEPALAQLPPVTAYADYGGNRQFMLSYALQRGLSDSPFTRAEYAPTSVGSAYASLCVQAGMDVVPSDPRNAAFMRRRMAADAPPREVAIRDALATIRGELYGIARDWNVSFEAASTGSNRSVHRVVCPDLDEPLPAVIFLQIASEEKEISLVEIID